MNKKMIAALALCMAGAANAQGIVNGDFEADGQSWTTLANWSYGGAVNWAGATPYYTAGSPEANGHGLAVLNGNDRYADGWLSQTFATTAGRTYFVSFDYGTTDSRTQQVDVVVSANGGQVLNNERFTGHGTALGTHTFQFTALDSQSTLTFHDVASNYSYQLDGVLDNVAITSPVPEPASVAMLTVGLAAVFGLRRRRG